MPGEGIGSNRGDRGDRGSGRTGLEDEEPLELVRGDEQDGELNAPEDQVADHALGRDTDALGDVVRDVKVRGPDGADDLSHGR